MGRKKREKGGGKELSYNWQKIRVAIWGIALILGFLFALMLEIGANKETALNVCCFSGVILSGCSIVLLPTISALRKCHFFKEVFWGLLNHILPWWTVLIVFLSLPSMIVAAKKADIVLEVTKAIANISIDKDEKDSQSQSENSETAGQGKIVLPKRNKKEFVWEEDIYIGDLSEYYDGDIDEKDEERYIRELILEDLSHMTNGEVKDKTSFSEDYSIKTTAANYSFELYLDIKDGPYPEENIENALQVAIDYRKRADDSQRVSGNLRQLGMLKDTLGDWKYERGKSDWEKAYEESLKYYILSIKHAVKEVENKLFSTEQWQVEDAWDAVIKEYGKLSGTEKIRNVIRTM